MRPSILLPLCALALAACERPLYPDTYEEIMARQDRLPGKIILIKEGSPHGGFKLATVVTGQVNTAGELDPSPHPGRPPALSWPATPHTYYEAWKYMDESDAPFYILRKIPAP